MRKYLTFRSQETFVAWCQYTFFWCALVVFALGLLKGHRLAIIGVITVLCCFIWKGLKEGYNVAQESDKNEWREVVYFCKSIFILFGNFKIREAYKKFNDFNIDININFYVRVPFPFLITLITTTITAAAAWQLLP